MTKNSYVAGQTALEQHQSVNQGVRGINDPIHQNQIKSHTKIIHFESKILKQNEDGSANTNLKSKRFNKVITMLKSLISRIKISRSGSLANREYFNYKEQRQFELENEKKRHWPNLLIFQNFIP